MDILNIKKNQLDELYIKIELLDEEYLKESSHKLYEQISRLRDEAKDLMRELKQLEENKLIVALSSDNPSIEEYLTDATVEEFKNDIAFLLSNYTDKLPILAAIHSLQKLV